MVMPQRCANTLGPADHHRRIDVTERTPTWSAALDAQLDLLRFWRSPEGMSTGNMVNVLPALHQGLVDFDTLTDPDNRAQVNEIGRKTAEEFADALDRGATYWVADEVVELLKVAGPTLPPATLRADDLPHPAGFVWFEHPIILPPPQGLPEGAPEIGPDHIQVMQWFAGDDHVRVVPYFQQVLHVTRYGTPIGAVTWNFGEPAPADTPAKAVLAQTMVAFWFLSQQRVVVTRRRAVSRPARRRAERAHFQIAEDGIQVVTLRRAQREHEETTSPVEVEWASRWLVNGHWRQQWYPASEEHRPLWINPYVKGPDGAPLVLKDRVYRFAR